MRVIDRVVLYSPTDLTAAAECEFALLRRMDEKLGRIPPLDLAEDPLRERAARLGDAHEARVMRAYLERFGPADAAEPGRGVVTVPRPGDTIEDLAEARDLTLTALRSGADVVFQAAFFDGRFNGFADFLLKQSRPTGYCYQVQDAKLARRAKVSALLQIAGYADQLTLAGVPVAEEGVLILGDGTESRNRLDRIVPVYRTRRARLEGLLDRHLAGDRQVSWGDDTIIACGRCDICQLEVDRHRDLLLVANLRMTQRAKLNTVGITTIDQLAASSGPIEGMAPRTLETLRAQARLQVGARPPAPPTADTGEPAGPASDPGIVYEIFDPRVLARLPAPSPGDVFFDFEGDPLWQEPGSADWGLEYLFGVVESPTNPGAEPTFRAFWAHDRAREKQALLDFLNYLRSRRERCPGMHVYHYAAYEKTALLRLAARHAVGEDDVDNLLRHDVLIDLYPIVRGCLRTSQPSYGLKALEPLFQTADARSGEVTSAADSVVQYAEYRDLRAAGDARSAAGKLREIESYNTVDCLSTLLLRDWLRARAAEHGVTAPAPTVGGDEPPQAADETSAAAAEEAGYADPLWQFAGSAGSTDRSPRQTAAALLAAGVGYHRREDKPYWWGHFDRLIHPVSEWADKGAALVVDTAQVILDWAKEGRQRSPRRVVEVSGHLEPGSQLERDRSCVCLYDPPLPDGLPRPSDGYRGTTNGGGLRRATVDEAGVATMRLVEILPRGCPEFASLPMALAPAAPIRTATLRDAIREVAEQALHALPAAPDNPVWGLLERSPPRLADDRPLPPVEDGDFVAAITEAVRLAGGSAIPVQGPPGTGKTYVGARVIANLVRGGWRIGVVAQSHAAVEHLLDEVVAAGVVAKLVGKKEKPSGSLWQDLPENRIADFLRRHEVGGCVIGGTAWDFTNPKRVPRGQLDLLVIDEAGQFSLADTIAVSVSTKRLLLLGDPRQLPQVSQGRHPEPVNESVLGWLTDGGTLDPNSGYFLDRTYRMHSALTERVSRLAYDGRLGSRAEVTDSRSMSDASGDPVPPGVRTMTIPHDGHSVSCPAEADAVVSVAREALTWTWTDPSARDLDTDPAILAASRTQDHVDGGGSADLDADPAIQATCRAQDHMGGSGSVRPGTGRPGTGRPMSPRDILVVAPYNAQVDLIRQRLQTAGLPDIAVGTVDKFQGQEAPVVIVSMTASSADDVPRGMGFLMSTNRLNVAASRGQWLAIVIRSGTLTDYLPATPEGLAELGGFLDLTEPPGQPARPASDYSEATSSAI